MSFMMVHMEIATEVSQKITEPAVMKLQKKNKVQGDAQRHALRRRKVLMRAAKLWV